MSLYKEKFKTDSHRLKNWDYSNEAVYFITIVTKDRKCIFGAIAEDKMVLNENGKIVETELLKSIKIRKNWFFHNWVIMPNHIHLLIEIQDKENHSRHVVETHSSASTHSLSTTENTISIETKFSRKTKSISSFVAISKSVTTKQIGGQQTIWQANFHDHIVRNYKRFEIIYNYIKTNPQRWETDSINFKF